MSEQLPAALLDLHKWDQLSHTECMEIALQIENLLPASFRFASIETYTSTSERHHIANFERTTPKQHTTTFALIPGGTVTLGYDREQPLLPSDELIYDAEEECLIPDVKGVKHTFNYELLQPDEIYNFSMSSETEFLDAKDQEKLPPNYQAIAEYMEGLLLPARTVILRPFLLEKERQRYHEGMFARNNRITHKLATELLAEQGFRFPTSDEWEYVCMAGREKLFFWEGSSKPLEYYPELPPNTFGVQIADNTYNWELCMEPGILRGGDGGYTQCGWAGYFAHYLVYTSAFYQTYDPSSATNASFRRAYSL